MFLIFDTETTGLPQNYNAPVSDTENWPRMVQLAWQVHAADGSLIEVKNYIVKPEGYTIPFNSEKIHGISTERALQEGHDLQFVLEEFKKAIQQSKFFVGHNIEFDIKIVGAEIFRLVQKDALSQFPYIDTKDESTDYCALPGGKGGKFKWPTLTELHQKLFGNDFDAAHNAAADVEATARCFLELVRLGVVTPQKMGVDDEFIRVFKEKNPDVIQAIGLAVKDFHEEEKLEATSVAEIKKENTDVDFDYSGFFHLHTHSQFSVLQATPTVDDLVSRAKINGMKAVAMTDHANLMGAFHFVKKALSEDIKPIIGCEFHLCNDRLNKTNKDNGFQVILLAKNKTGYHNLLKLVSASFTDGFYYVPRIDRELLLQYKQDLIALSGWIYGEIPSLILNQGEKPAIEAIEWWKENFGDDFYFELNRHGLKEEEVVNEFLIQQAKEKNIKLIAANNVYYIHKEDAETHDVLLCVRDGELKSTPIGKGRGFRWGFPNNEFYFKSQEEMAKLFADIPESITNTFEVFQKVESYKLQRDVLLPNFDIPEEFINPEDEKDGGKRGENAYLRHLTYEGAKKKYPEITDEIRERIDFELETVAKTGYPGYFLIVQDFTRAARDMGVSVGPGRGSAAGSVVAYCIGITNVDPIEYDLLFERFLNPDRVSMPDIDIDFDDEGRGKVLDYVIKKYGSNQVAQIITYGTMAAKSAIRDAARVLDLPLYEADKLAKLVPALSLEKLDSLSENEINEKLNGDSAQKALALKQVFKGSTPDSLTLQQAKKLEGSLRNTGIHACGVIITPSDMTDHVPVATAKDAELMVTQFDNSVVESAGLLKMDFLGLKTLTIIKDAIAIIKDRHGIVINPDEIPLDDEKTYKLYQRGETNGTFQFESPGMQKHLRALKPDQFGDLIAMNALYRPGPMEYIPNFIARKHGKEPITYDFQEMEEYLAETYGITVYQEQVMLLSQKLAGFTKGEADELRKGMGKKKKEIIDRLKPKFIEGCQANGLDAEVAEKVWKDWEAFASYAFNKSHSTCYSVVAFHTAYLKANYPAEYMASVLTHNMNDIKKVTFFMEECKRAGIKVLGPDVNESQYKFTVNDKGQIRFGLGALKGVGGGAVESIVQNRTEGGKYVSITDFIKRVDLRSVNKKTLESLAYGGAFDSFGLNRSQYFFAMPGEETFIEKLAKFGGKMQENQNSSQTDLFGGMVEVEIAEPQPPVCEDWGTMEKLNKEKEVVGFYISGHPLDDYKIEVNNFCNISLDKLSDLSKINGKQIKVAGVVSDGIHATSKKGNPYGKILLEGYNDSYEFMFFSEDYIKYKGYIQKGFYLFIEGVVQSKKWNQEEFEIKVNQIHLLSEVKEKMAKGLLIQAESNDFTPELIHELDQVFVKYEGDFPISLNIIDKEESVKINLRSRSRKVNLENDLINELQSIPEVSCKIMA